jgi:rhamnosyltransferase
MAPTERHRLPCVLSSPGAVVNNTAATRPSVLVLLATYNGSRWIREQMESILAQEGIDLAIALRDEGSIDATNRELARFADHEKIDIVTVPVASGSPARSFLSLIRENPAGASDFVAFSDQDDLWNPDKLVRGCRMLEANTAVGYSSATIAAWEDGRETLTEISGPPTAMDFLFEGAGQGCTFVLTRDFYERVRRFIAARRDLTDQVHYHDWLIYALARSWELQWCFDLEPSMRYRQHAGNHTGARGSFRGVIKRLRMIRQGWYRIQLEAIAGICRTAAPGNDLVRAWHHELAAPRSWRRRLRIARFCLRGARRRRRDNMVAVLSALCGWI